MVKILVDTIRKADIFGKRPEFHVKGSESYKTVLGAILSLGILFLVLPYAVNNFHTMYKREGTRFETKTIFSEEDNTRSLEDMGISLAFGVFSETNLNAYDPRYLEWNVKLETYELG